MIWDEPGGGGRIADIARDQERKKLTTDRTDDTDPGIGDRKELDRKSYAGKLGREV